MGILQQDRRLLLFQRLRSLPGTGVVHHLRLSLGEARLGDPPLQEDDSAVGEQLLPGGLLGQLRHQPVGADLQILPNAAHGGNFGGHMLPLLGVLGKLGVNAGDVLRGGAAELLKAHRGEGPGLHRLGHGLGLVPVADQKQIVQLLVHAGLEKLGGGRSL